MPAAVAVAAARTPLGRTFTVTLSAPMTATATATAVEDEQVEDELLRVDPTTLVVGANVRLDPRLRKSYVENVRARGVLEPVVAYRDDDGRLVVLFGQRRTLAAVQAQRPWVRVTVVPKPDEADRLTDQVNENDHREPLTVAERVAAYEQLALCGVPAGEIAKRMSTSRPVVDKALTVARSKLARGATQRWEFLSIDQAAVVAEFEDDPEAVKRLVVAAQRGGFDHEAQKLRDARAEAAAKVEAAAALAAAGITLVDRPSWNDEKVKRLSRLKHGEEQLTEDNHASCPGHAAFLDDEWVHPDEDEDEDDGDDPWGDDTPAGADENAERPEPARPYRAWLPEYVCTDFAAHGHALRWQEHDSASGRKTIAEMTDVEREEARAQRRDVIQSNKAWDSAETVRRNWLRTFLARKAAPKTAAGFIAGSLARTDHAVTSALTGGNRLAHDLLGLPDQAPTLGRRAPAMVELVGKASDERAQMIALGLLLAAYEEATSRNSWRSVSESTTRYLRYLEANGYELSTVELRACGESPLPATDANLAAAEA
ncbi:ParB N-terminal domain-containing protein [Micromonospora sp. WMMD1102]|uniref:ParB/RepB/Spo0J family partition protein n=1 Tax=Micromonospora sp. WMMD1102 TaxID=3016105 RepID=UPI002415595E|nr:ParB N-terminal domain-containing protein [Micromonospora sp. WMMD1102]MDG4784904.1 ParB N-terminal domain-containing protein [Micromonospora sp. WMMD1102]